MSFDLTVVPIEWANSTPPDPATPEYDVWQRCQETACLFAARLGADGTVGLYWSGIARTLDLPLLAGIYECGLRLDSTSELETLALELDEIESGWQSMELPDPGHRSWLRGQVREHLAERLASFREALRVAMHHGAVLIVS